MLVRIIISGGVRRRKQNRINLAFLFRDAIKRVIRSFKEISNSLLLPTRHLKELLDIRCAQINLYYAHLKYVPLSGRIVTDAAGLAALRALKSDKPEIDKMLARIINWRGDAHSSKQNHLNLASLFRAQIKRRARGFKWLSHMLLTLISNLSKSFDIRREKFAAEPYEKKSRLSIEEIVAVPWMAVVTKLDLFYDCKKIENITSNIFPTEMRQLFQKLKYIVIGFPQKKIVLLFSSVNRLSRQGGRRIYPKLEAERKEFDEIFKKFRKMGIGIFALALPSPIEGNAVVLHTFDTSADAALRELFNQPLFVSLHDLLAMMLMFMLLSHRYYTDRAAKGQNPPPKKQKDDEKPVVAPETKETRSTEESSQPTQKNSLFFAPLLIVLSAPFHVPEYARVLPGPLEEIVYNVIHAVVDPQFLIYFFITYMYLLGMCAAIGARPPKKPRRGKKKTKKRRTKRAIVSGF